MFACPSLALRGQCEQHDARFFLVAVHNALGAAALRWIEHFLTTVLDYRASFPPTSPQVLFREWLPIIGVDRMDADLAQNEKEKELAGASACTCVLKIDAGFVSMLSSLLQTCNMCAANSLFGWSEVLRFALEVSKVTVWLRFVV